MILLWFLSAVLFTALGVAGYWYYTRTKQDEQVDTQTGSEEPEAEEEELPATNLVEVNYHRDTESPNYEYFTFQTKYPSDYVVVNDDMQTEYISQGGMAPPVLTFYKPLSLSQLEKRKDDKSEIRIWSTSGFNSIEDWLTTVGLEDFEVKDESTAKYKDFNFSIQNGTVERDSQKWEMRIAFLDLGNKITYFFEASNDYVEDLDIILENFDTREARCGRDFSE